MGHSYGLFVDAGHFYASAGQMLSKTKKPLGRASLEIDHGALVQGLINEAYKLVRDDFHCMANADPKGPFPAADPIRLLRCYWYDGAKDFVPSSAQREIGKLPNVKLRLGKWTAAGQKGVDGLLILDLVTLAQEKSIDTAFVLSGDEDLREAAARAQSLGVRVVLFGMPNGSQAETLVAEADRHEVLPKVFWTKYVSLKAPVVPAALAPVTPRAPDSIDVEQVSSSILGSWLSAATPEEIAQVVASNPRIPQELDASLLQAATSVSGGSLPQSVRENLRAAFWSQLQKHASGGAA